MKALIIGGSGKLLGLLEITWGHVFLTPHYLLILGYTLLCLLTTYSGKKFHIVYIIFYLFVTYESSRMW